MISRIAALLTALFGLLLGAAPILAQSSPTAEEIIERLKSGRSEAATGGPRRITRGLSAPAGPQPSAPSAVAPTTGIAPVPPPAVDRYFIAPRRGLSIGERNEVAKIAQVRPAIDLTIYFDFNSAEIRPKAVPALAELARALASSELRGTRFLLAGHTDAKGSDTYNLALSQRRADSIRTYLVGRFNVDAHRLLAVGYGEEQLKNKSHPFADENRRVQVVNFGG